MIQTTSEALYEYLGSNAETILFDIQLNNLSHVTSKN